MHVENQKTPKWYQDEEELDKFVPSAPDGGWGWVVVLASFMIHVFADGFTYTFGIFYVSILNYFSASKSATSWIASILVGVTLGSGPISGTLVNRYGCRVVTILGAILASFSLFVSIFAESVAVLYLTIGVGAGLGFGLIYLPAIISVTGYFEKKRSFATGIAVCGSGIGTFVFSPLVEYLIQEYSWKGALIIISGLMLNCVVFGALFRPLDLEYIPPHIDIGSNGAVTEEMPFNSNNVALSDIPRIEISDTPPVSPLVDEITPEDDMPRVNSHSYIESHHRKMLRRFEEVTRMSVSQPLLPGQDDAPTKNFDHNPTPLKGSLPAVHGSGLLYRKDIFYRGSLQNIQEFKANPRSYRSSVMRLPDMEETDSEKQRQKICGCVPCSKEVRETFHRLAGWELLSDRIFLLFILSNFCTSIGFNAPYIFIVDRALELGISSDYSSYLLATVGISNTISRVILGYISDRPSVNRLYVYNLALTLCGIGTLVSIWFQSFGMQVFYAAIFGSTSGAYVGLTSVVLVDLLGMEKLTNAFGLLLMFQGIASLIGPPLCGALYDMSKSYDYSFILAGAMIAVSGLMLFFIPCVTRIQERHEEKRKNDVNYYT